MPSRDIFHVEIMQQFFIMILPPCAWRKFFTDRLCRGNTGTFPDFIVAAVKTAPFAAEKEGWTAIIGRAVILPAPAAVDTAKKI